jgi:hypothetical protein
MHYWATYHGLHDWADHQMRHLGYMWLAKNKGYKTKIKGYYEGIKHLEAALKESIEQTVDPDRKRDEKILLHNVQILAKGAKKLLGGKSKSSSRESVHSSHSRMSSRPSRRKRSKN